MSLQLALDLLVDKLVDYAEAHGMKFGFANGAWHVYKRGFWSVMPSTDREDMERVLSQLCPQVDLVYSQRKTIVDIHLRTAMPFRISTDQFDTQPYIAVRNGTVDLSDGALVEHSSDHMTTRFIDIDYAADAECPEWEQIVVDILGDYDETNRGQVASFIQEWMGVALAGGADARTPRALRKALFLYGPPNAGKSTVFDVVRELIGTDRVAAPNVGEVARSKFGLEEFLSASAWITEEVEDLRREAGTSRIKCLITGEPVSVQRKGEKNSMLRFNGPVGWAGNTAPNFAEASNAVYDRIVTVPMERTFTPAQAYAKFGKLKPVEWLYEKGEIPGIFNWALKGYYRLLARGQFEDINVLRSAREAWREQNDAVFEFIRNYCELDPAVQNNTEVLAPTIRAFAKAKRPERWPADQTIKKALFGTIRGVFPEIERQRPRTDAGRYYTYPGLKLTEAGLAYWKSALEDDTALAGRKLVPNEPVLFQGTDPPKAS